VDLLCALDSAPMGVLVLELEEVEEPGSLAVVYANEQFKRRLGPGRVEGRRMIELLPGLRGMTVLERCAEVARGGERCALGDIVYRDARIEPVVVKGVAQPLPGGRAAVFLRDVTMHRRAEEEARADLAKKSQLMAELDAQLDVIARQQAEILRLSAPVLELWDGVLVVPMVGTLDEARSADVTARLLDAVGSKQAWCVVLDLTGVDAIETDDARHLLHMIRALGLMGARPVVTGIRPAVAQTLVALGADLGGATMLRDLREALRVSLGRPVAEEGAGRG
jgi:anti-anti-sigma regulatory factor